MGIRIQLFLVAVMAVQVVQGQEAMDNNPPRTRFFQLNTPHFKVIYPAEFGKEAQRMANTLEWVYEPEARTLGSRPGKYSVILQNQTSFSNGFVSVTPRRSEFYTMPPQDYTFSGVNDWLDHLVSHEYRHIVQYRHANRGFNRLFYLLSGNNGLALMSNIAVPLWFWEGDAVAVETAYLSTGRGSIPRFGLEFRTNLLEGRGFNYHKQYLRSYKHNVPNHYVLGYYMVSHLRRKTNDAEIWGKVTARTWNVPFYPFAFSHAIKKEAGMGVVRLYKDMASTLKKEWEEQLGQLAFTGFEKVVQRKSKTYTDYLYPQPMDDGSVLVLKRGIGDIEKLVMLKNGKERKVKTPGIMNASGLLSSTPTKVVWNEFGFDARWGMRNYSLVKGYDFASRKMFVISPRKARHSGAALSPDGYKVVTVFSNPTYQHRVTVLDFYSGKTLQEFDNPDNSYFSMCRWTDDGESIVALKILGHKKSVVLIDAKTGALKELVPPSSENIGHPVLKGNFLLFNLPARDIDNIFAIDIQRGKRYQVTVSKHGAYNPSITRDGKYIYYNEQTVNGMDVVRVPFDPSTWKPVEKEFSDNGLAHQLKEQEGRPGLMDSVPQKEYAPKRYSRFLHGINPHSWGAYLDENLEKVDVGIYSKDILSTTSIRGGYVYDIQERTGNAYASLSYQGLFPIVSMTVQQGKRSIDMGDFEFVRYNATLGKLDTLTRNLSFAWTERNVEGGLSIPLNLTRSKYFSGLTLSNTVGFTEVTDFRNSIDNGGRMIPYDTSGRVYFFRDYIDNGTLGYNHLSFSAHALMKRSRRDINSKWGLVMYGHVLTTPFKSDFSGSLSSFYSVAYLPGLFKHHSLWGYWAWQHTSIADLGANGSGFDNYIFRNRIPLARGQDIRRYKEMYSFSVNYTMPVMYPDIAIGPLVNIQRFRINLFGDYTYGITKSKRGISDQTYLSTGVEFKADMNVFRLLPQFDLGFRYTYGVSPSATKFEVLIGTINF